jgi:translation initiation factor IF-2
LEALRQAQQAPPPSVAAPAPSVTPAPAPAPAPNVPQENAAREREAEAARKAAAEQAYAPKSTESAADAAKRKKAQEEIAKRLEKLNKELARAAATPANGKPAVVPVAVMAAPPATAKEQRLAELLRRYKADEITPLQYHTERAKIIAEP